jgi:MFS family permease
MDTICCCVFHFFIYYNYSAPLLALDQFSSDLYVNDIVFSTGTLCSAIVCFYLIGDLPRKKMVYFSTALSFIFVVPQYFASNCKDNCESVKIVETISMFIFRVLLEVSYQTFYFIQNEIFPTQIRTLAILFTAITSNTVTIFIPLVADFNETHNYFLPCSFIVSGIFVMAATSQLRETLGVPPPEIIEELAYTPNQK